MEIRHHLGGPSNAGPFSLGGRREPCCVCDVFPTVKHVSSRWQVLRPVQMVSQVLPPGPRGAGGGPSPGEDERLGGETRVPGGRGGSTPCTPPGTHRGSDRLTGSLSGVPVLGLMCLVTGLPEGNTGA